MKLRAYDPHRVKCRSARDQRHRMRVAAVLKQLRKCIREDRKREKS